MSTSVNPAYGPSLAEPGEVPASDATAAKTQDRAQSSPRTHLVAARRYLAATLGCGAFALIYAQFSHGVYSPFMTFMFAIPLVGGAVLSCALYLAKAQGTPRTTRQAWALALASLTLASCLHGVFDIAGTASPYLPAYLALAAAFALAAAAMLVRERRREP